MEGKFGANLPSMTELEQRTAIAFVNTNPAVDHMAPLPENIIPIGGLHIRDTKPLPKVIFLNNHSIAGNKLKLNLEFRI